MGMVAVNGMEWPPVPGMDPDSGFQSTTLDATGEKVAWCGPVWFEGAGPKNITKVGWRFNTHVVAGGSGATLSLQNVSTAAGAPIQPDGTPDQTVAVTLPGTAGWFKSNALSATRSVNKGEMLAVVLEFNGGGRLGADTIIVQNIEQVGPVGRSLNAGLSLFTASWVIETCHPCILLEFDDGTFGRILGGYPSSTKATHTYNSGSASDEYALRVDPPVSMEVDGFWMLAKPAANTADFDVVLYEDSTTLETVSFDANAIDTADIRVLRGAFQTVRTLRPGKIYRLSLKPTTANNVSLYSLTMDAAAHRQALPGGEAVARSDRADGGAWTDDTTRYVFAGFTISGVMAGPAQLVNNAGLVG